MGLYETPREVAAPSDYEFIETPEVDGSVLRSAFRRENLVGDLLRSERAPRGALMSEEQYQSTFGVFPKEDFNAWSLIEGTENEEHWNAFAGVRSRAEYDSLVADLDAQRRDEQVLQQSGTRGVLAAMLAGFIDVPTLLPGASAIRGGRTGLALLKNSARTATYAASEAAAVEYLLHSSQETRENTESAAAIGGSFILGGLLGAGATAALRNTPYGAVAFDNAARYLDGKQVETGQGLDLELREAESLSAAKVDIRPETSDFELPNVTAQKALDLTPQGVTFANTFAQAKSPVAQKLGYELLESPLAIRGVDRLELEPAVETAQNVALDRARLSIAETMGGEYANYRKAQAVGRFDGVLNKLDGKLSEADFSARVAAAMRRGDQDPVAEVAAAASRLRKEVIEPLKQAAIEEGLLPEDVSVSGADSYFSRLWDSQQIVARSTEFKQRIADHILKQDKRRRLKGEEGYADASDVELKGDATQIADDVFNTLTAKGRLPDGLRVTVKSRGPMKQRTLNVRDVDFEDFLVSDAELVLNRYARTMTADIELKKRFGSSDIELQLGEVYDDYQKLIDAAPEGAERNALEAERNRVLDRIRAVRDLMRGTYKIGDREGVPYRVIQSAMTYNFVRALGGLVFSALPDVTRSVMQNGLQPFMEGAARPMMANLKGYRMQAKQARELAGIAEVQLNNRLMNIADITDPLGNRTPVENALQTMGAYASKYSGGGYWNDFFKGMATQVTTNRLRHLGRSKTDEVFLKRLKLNRRDADAIYEALNEYGVEAAGVFDPRVDAWPKRPRELYAKAIRADADLTIVTPGIGDKVPAAEHHYWLKPALQFKSFAIAAHHRVLISGLQEDQARFLMASISMSAMGAFVYYIKAISAGREPSDNPGVWIAEGIDRSGVAPLVFEMNNWLEGMGAPGIYSILSQGEEEASRYAVRSTSGKVLGPTAGLMNDSATVISRLLSQVNPLASDDAKDIKEGDIGAARRLIPFGRHPGVKEYLDLHLVPDLKEKVR